MAEQASDEHEQGYIEGRRRTALNLLSHAIRELTGLEKPEDKPLLELARAISQREETVAALRTLCKDFGFPNDWPDQLHLADVVNKCLAPVMRHQWRSTDPRKDINKRADIVILRPHPGGKERWQSGTAHVDTKEVWSIFVSGFEGHTFIGESDAWPTDWVWTWSAR
jgi:hypothetical protein